jgi:acyl-CoA synthetase (AMP-forming)/AMP-acid ligase II
MAAPLMLGPTTVLVSEPVESRGYIDLTVSALATFGVSVRESRTKRDGIAYRAYAVADDARLVCERVLPQYHHPRAYVHVAHIPLTATGKPARHEAEKLAK